MNSHLPNLKARGLILKNKEICHFQSNAYIQEFEQIFGPPETYKYDGILYITNKRIVFINNPKTITYQNTSIVRVERRDEKNKFFSLHFFKENQTKITPIYVPANRVSELLDVIKVLFNYEV